MPPFRFIHAADLHLDSPFRGLTEVAPTLQTLLRDATLQAFDNIVDLCLKRHVDFLLIAGDVYDARDRSLRAVTRLRRSFERLGSTPAFLCHGNHDPWDGTLSWPANVCVFGTESVEAKPVFRDGQEIARVYGISYPTEKIVENLALKFRRDADAPWAIGLLHANVGGNPNHGNYAPCQLDDLKQSGLDYWALGHVHTRQVLHERDPVIVYPGNPQGRHVNETGPRGCYVVDVDAAGYVEYEFVPVDVVRWDDQIISIEGIRDMEELVQCVDDRVQALQREHQREGMIVRWQLQGRGELHRELSRPGRLDELLAVVRERWGAGPGFVWTESFIDNTDPEIDRAALLQEENLLGDFLRLAETDDETTLEEFRRAMGEVFDDPRIRRFMDAPTDEQLREWIRAAERLGIDRLLKGNE